MSNPKFDEFLVKYPNLFKEEPRSGFSVGEGWLPLLHQLCNILEHTIENLPDEISHAIYVAQVKEKFGSLRFYMNESTPYMDGAIALAENMSINICEVCGKPGVRTNKGWVRARCKKHDPDKKK